MKHLLLGFCLALAGCNTPIIKPVEVRVPIPVKCEPTVQFSEVDYAFDRATTEMSLYDKLTLALIENNSLRGQNKELSAALGECIK